jgi:succinate dehydrogenase/fumarate reductase cytochrome b subunit
LDTTGAVDLSGITSYSAFWDRYNAHGSHAITKYVATCVRVAWKCHQFGGLPAALAALDFGDVDMVAADYLDYFDSTSESDDAELVEVVPDGL